MYQAVGKIVDGKIIGFTLYNLQSGKIMGIPIEKCKEGVRKGIIKNLEILEGELITTDGMLPNLPTYDRTGKATANSLPVILERFVIGNDNKTVGFSYIVNGEYRKGTSEELLRKYSKFYNAKTYTSGKVPIIASKRGSFYIVKLREDDFIIEKGVLKAYKGKSKKDYNS